MNYKGKKVAILGYGIEGADTEKYMKKQGAVITILDKKLDKKYLKGLENFDVIVRSAGVYRYLPEIVQAEHAGVKVTSAIKIFFENCPGKIIGVTGTKGKGTTSTLISEILKADKRKVYLAGNIGKPYLELLPQLKKNSIVVLELSSFQLIDMDVSPDIAVVLNITSDHLNWHKDVEEYISAKRNIVKHQAPSDFAVVNADYEISKSFAGETKGKVVLFSKSQFTNGCFVESGDLTYMKDDKKIVLGKSHWLLLRGEHNLENVTAAVTVAIALGIDEEIIKKVVFAFAGLEHRLELVGSFGGISFYNDSFATGPQPTVAAIRSFEEPETLILGGSDKNLDFTELGQIISKKKNVQGIVLIGDVAEKIKTALKDANYKGKLIEMGKKSMDKIVQEAFSATPKGGVVLLSPAAASFDMFKDYKDRGNKFKSAVEDLKNG